ncbi:MAG: virulence RhuM family protein [Clostridia bacterium]|nr:virulence RhuM family protein [Clostridia bacterium]
MDNKVIATNNDIIFLKRDNGEINIELLLNGETLWVTQKTMAEIFDVQRPDITKHLKKIFESGELDKNQVCSKMEHTASDGKTYNIEFYNLDAIISVGYRVNSKKATEFRIWATKILNSYMTKGFALDDDRFLKGGKVNQKYFDELLERIKVIRTSERMAYQKITDLFMTTSIDYDKNSEEAYNFFKIVQNKLHYAITGHTAAELIYERVNSEKVNMGLTTWTEAPDGMIYKYDVSVAKNYLNEEELKKLNNLTEMFLITAQTEAEEQRVMTMKDWINVTDDLLKYRKKEILKDSGKISHKKAIHKAHDEYEKYRIKQDEQYISSMDEMYKKYLEEERDNSYNTSKK